MKLFQKFMICVLAFNMLLLNIYVLDYKEVLNLLIVQNSYQKQTEHW